jgi:hypothetical protein
MVETERADEMPSCWIIQLQFEDKIIMRSIRAIVEALDRAWAG